MAECCRTKGLSTIESFLEDVSAADLPQVSKVFVSFELFEHLHDPNLFVQHISSLMGEDDIFIFTTLSGCGVDIQALWEDSKSVSPPHHLNFFNPKSITLLLNKQKFDVLHICTPGKLDINILYSNSTLIKDRFWGSFIKLSDEKSRESMQNLISTLGLSSHMLVVCRKRR